MAQDLYNAKKGQDVDVNNLTVAGAAAIAGALTALGFRNTASQDLTATAAITIDSGVVTLAHTGTIIAATLDAPTKGDMLLIVNTSASGTIAHTVTLPSGVTWDGTNRIATLNAPNEALFVYALSATRFFVISNLGSVAFS